MRYSVSWVMLSSALLAIVCLATAPLWSAPKATRESAYTDISGTDCKGSEDNDSSCIGVGLQGWELEIMDEGNIIQLAIYRKGQRSEALLLTGRGLGDKAEWRGTRSQKGFRPDALIVRMRPVEDDDRFSSLLYIVKLNPRNACLSGLVDAKANREANGLARSAADKLPDTCPVVPRISGVNTDATFPFSK